MVRRLAILLAGLSAALAFFLLARQPLPAPHQAEKLAAVELARQAQQLIGSRLSGPEYTLITTTLAPRQAKELSRQPDFAALAADWLLRAGIRPGDRVAVNLSGSFPALNIAVLAAVRAVGAEPVITASVGASTWGATDPDFTWLDMERQLREAALWPWTSSGASPGGVGDRGGGLTPEGRQQALEAIRRNRVPLIDPPDLQRAIARRLELYRGPAGVLPPVLVNVGGGHVIFGEAGHRLPLPTGLTTGLPPLRAGDEGLAAAFLQSNRPVIHFLNISRLAARYGILAGAPPGSSGVFRSFQLPPPWRLAAAAVLTAALLFLWRGRPQKEV